MEQEREIHELLTYLGKKYREPFSFLGKYGGGTESNALSILARSKKYPDRIALARWREKEGQIFYEDNYLAFILKEELQEIQKELAQDFFGSCKVTYRVPSYVFPFGYSGRMSGEEFLKQKGIIPEFHILPEKLEDDRGILQKLLYAYCEENRRRGYQIRGSVRMEGWVLHFSMKEEIGFHYVKWVDKRG